jgi:hypothetical protein
LCDDLRQKVVIFLNLAGGDGVVLTARGSSSSATFPDSSSSRSPIRVASQSEDVRVATANLEFTSRWSTDGDRFIQHCEFKSQIDEPLCGGEVRKETYKALTAAPLFRWIRGTNQDSRQY